jgi:hypothetical protein
MAPKWAYRMTGHQAAFFLLFISDGKKKHGMHKNK